MGTEGNCTHPPLVTIVPTIETNGQLLLVVGEPAIDTQEEILGDLCMTCSMEANDCHNTGFQEVQSQTSKLIDNVHMNIPMLKECDCHELDNIATIWIHCCVCILRGH